MAEEGKTPQQKQEELQKMMSEIRESQQNIEALEKQIEVINSSIKEVESTEETLEGIEDIESGSEILVPIGSGSYIPAVIKDTEKVLTELGADLVAESPPEKVIDLVGKRRKDLEESLEEAQERIDELKSNIEKMRPEAQKLMTEVESEGMDNKNQSG